VNNFFGFASYPQKIEMLIKIDNDQKSLYDDLKNSPLINRYNVKIYCGERYGYINVHRYLDDLIRMAVGDILFCLGEGVRFMDHGWDEELYRHRNGVCILYHKYYYNEQNGICETPNNFNWVAMITRKLYDIMGRFSPTPFSDQYLDYLGGISGIHVKTNIRVLMMCDKYSSIYSKEQKTSDWITSQSHISSREIREQLTLDNNKILEYLSRKNIPRNILPEVFFGTNLYYSVHPTIEIRGGLHREYLVEFVNKSNGDVLYSIKLLPYNWASCLFHENVHYIIGRVSSEKEGIFFEKEMEI
jgi:hypothetical protein